ncbi:MAG: FlgD immunoglobulin-like domain containing protein [Smithella sp.]
MTTISSLASSTSASTTTTSSSALSSLTSDDFLTLLLTELQNQDPTDPVSTGDMLQQFSTLTQVANSEKTNSYLSSLADNMSTLSNSQNLNYIGKTITYSCDSITVSNGTAGNLSFDLASDTTDVVATIYNSSGTVVNTIDLGSLSSGSYSLSWDGTDSSGSGLSDGTYTAKYSAKDSSGNSVTVTTSGTVEVTGVVYNSGDTYLVTANGDIPVSSVTAVQ